ncbi:MAG: hypothetical protein FWH01_16575 [Oscillospiraceae bacterium]|nr:hypothetical protein [Oscillospiraceae bacterium]
MKTTGRQIIYTAAGLALSLAIAVGGWALTSMLIDIKSDALLSTTGTVYIDVPSQAAGAGQETGDNVETGSSAETGGSVETGSSVVTGDSVETGDSMKQERPVLTGQDVYNILHNWEATGSERVHEPSEAQLGMEEAIEVAKSGLAFFCEEGVLPSDILEQEIEKINAYLCQNQANGQTAVFLDAIYSYWTIEMTCERYDAIFVINAVAGQLWKANIVVSTDDEFFGNQSATKLVDAFVSYLDMHSDDKWQIGIEDNEIFASTNIADSMILATAEIRSDITGHAFIVTEVNLYLTTQPAAAGEIIVVINE